MNTDPTNHNLKPEQSDTDEMLAEYDFSHAKPGRYRGFAGRLIRVLEDGTEQVIELKPKEQHSTPE